MCGFVGIYGDTTEKELARMLAPLAMRGPDGEGVHIEPGFGCAHRRLAVIGPDARGAQPMQRDGVVVVFNGCIYNHASLRAALEKEGVVFTSSTDTEVLPHLYRRKGEAMLAELQGMFAFLIWDRQRRRLFGACDAFGEKPLVGMQQGARWLFASTLDALAQVASLTIEPARIAELVRTMRIRAPRTIYREAWRLPAGCAFMLDANGFRAWRWFRPKLAVQASIMREEDALPRIAKAFDASVKARLIADRPLGVFLSGGVDSSLVVEAAARLAGRVHCYSVRMADAPAGYDESAYAAEVARVIGAAHTVLEVRAEAANALDELARALDQPLGNSTALVLLLLARAAREHLVVALHGVGGDELFGGYPRHLGALWHARLRHILRAPWIKALARRLPDREDARNLPGRLRRFLLALDATSEEAYAAWLSACSEQSASVLAVPAREGQAHLLPDLLVETRDWREALWRHDPVRAAMAYDVLVYLPDDLLAIADRTTMHASLELRAPFLSPALFELAFACAGRLHVRGLPWREGLKRLLKALARKRLPSAAWRRPKQGFMLPIRRWLAQDLAPMLEGLQRKGAVGGFVRSDFVARMRAEHAAGRDRADVLWTLLLLDRWLAQRGISA